MRLDKGLIKYSISVMLYFLLSASCRDEAENYKVSEISVYITDSIYLPITESSKQLMRIKELPGKADDTTELIQYIKEGNHFLYTFDISKGKVIDSFSMNDHTEGLVDFFPKTKDSTYIALYNNTILLTARGRIINEWNIQNDVERAINPMAFIANVSLNPFQVFGDTAFCVTSTREANTNKGPNIPFLKSNFDVAFSLGDCPKLIYKRNLNPEHLQFQGYYSLSERAYLNNHKIVYSFSHSDTMYLFNFQTKQLTTTKLRTANFYPNIPFDYSKNTDFKYIMQYSLEQSRMTFGGLFFDKSHNHVLQLMKHKGEYISRDGMKNTWEDLASSLFVLDTKLNQLEEILIPQRTLGSTYFAFITSKGLYFPVHSIKQKYNGKMLFYRIIIP